jgi:hypothetical protein
MAANYFGNHLKNYWLVLPEQMGRLPSLLYCINYLKAGFKVD